MNAVPSHPGALVLINCTSRKRKPASGLLRVNALTPAPSASVATEWVTRLERAQPRYPAAQLYCGRSVVDSLTAAERLSGSLYFVSAGLGLVAASALVPSYNLTIAARNPDSVLPMLTEEGAEATRWWAALTAAHGAQGQLVELVRSTAGLVILAMPSTYLSLIGEELLQVPDLELPRLRILGPRRPDEVPERLRSQWLPYDRRLNAQAGYAGTEADFPHRALRHFAERIWPESPTGSAAEHVELVNRLLGTRHVARRIPGQKMTDDELKPVIRELWTELNGNRSRILRALRLERRVACEQSRFKRLADQLEGEKRAARSA